MPQQADGEASTSPRPLIIWVLLLVALTVGGAVWLSVEGGSYQDFSVAILVIAYSPTIAAIFAVSIVRGGVRALLAQLLRWRAGAHWYAIALLGPLLVALAATALAVTLGGAAPRQWLALPPLATLPALLGSIMAGSLGEEPGWRGFAQPRLQHRISALTAAVIVGIIWAIWHLWPALTPLGRAVLSTTDVTQTVLRLVSTAVVYAWLYNSSNGALPVVLVAHAAHNVGISLMPADVIGTDTGAWTVALLYAAAAVTVIALTSHRSLTRQTQVHGDHQPSRFAA